MDAEEFAAVVAAALESLPDQFRRALDNVEVVVEEWPDRHTLREMGLHSPYELLGFYHGVPLPERTHDYGLVAPDLISIYRQPIMADAVDEEDLRDLIRHVVLHEIAHYFGIDDDRLHELGAY